MTDGAADGATPYVIGSVAASTDDLAATARLFEDYVASLGVDLSYQDIATELATLPGRYAAPRGALLLARDRDGAAIGCVALRPMDGDGRCEMKRLYVAPAGRGRGLGRALVDAVVDAARGLGYRAMRLDTLPSMDAAIALYRAAGFVSIPPYYPTPVEGTLFMERALLDDRST